MPITRRVCETPGRTMIAITSASPSSVSAPSTRADRRTASGAALPLARPARYVTSTAAITSRTSAWPCSLSGRLANAFSMVVGREGGQAAASAPK